MEELLQGLNPAQRLAVTSPVASLQVLAPPGSGKTKTLTARVSHLITVRKLRPWNIIVCTFTVKSAREMKERIKGTIGDELAKKLVLGTFHSVARRYLVSYGHNIGIEKNFGIADMSDSKAIITRIIKRTNLSIEPSSAGAKISGLKAKSITCDQYASAAKNAEQEFAIVYTAYEEALKASNLLDYDDLLLRCADLLRQHPECVSNIESVLVDEFQDTNTVQLELMCLFAQYKKHVTIVGDPDQSIYGWRNAEIKNLGRMELRFPQTHVIHLEENYRSAAAILQSAQKVIEQDTSRPAKALKPTFGIGDRPVLRKLPSADAEARWLVAEIQRTRALTAGVLDYNDFAVLLRSASVSRHIESALGKAGVPYRMVGGTKFFDRFEIKLVIDYLRVLNQPEQNDALIRVINMPTRGVGELTLKSLIEEADRKKMPLWKLILASAQGSSRPQTKLSTQAQKGIGEFTNLVLTGRKKLAGIEGDQASPFELVEWVLKKLEYEKFLKKKYPDDYETRWLNIDELKAQTADLTTAITHGEEYLEGEVLPEIEGVEQRAVSSTEDALTLYLANIALSNEVQQKTEENSEQTQQHVTISTIHAAKGLEWPVVFIPACYHGHIPHSRSEDTDEERRLLYVGMTRAQALLYLSCPTRNSQSGETTMSPFLTQQGADSFLDDRGPKLEDYAIMELVKTLRRERPQERALWDARLNLDQPEDDYWPLDGTWPEDKSRRWDHGKNSDTTTHGPENRKRRFDDRPSSPKKAAGFVSASTITIQNQNSYSVSATTLPTKFVSAAERMNQLEAVQEEAKLRAIDQRVQDKATSIAPSKKVKKAAQGTASITSFFGKAGAQANKLAASATTLSRTSSVPESCVQLPPPVRRQVSNPLNDISNTNFSRPSDSISATASLPSYKPRMQPLVRKTTTTQEPVPIKKDYTFLSSPPQRSPSPPTQVAQEPPPSLQQTTGFKPASTFHTTSVAQVHARPNSGKTLGMKGRPFVPWNARGGRGS
ncbi:P-loop containing nucleoside triphosphate hydrolase protein [Delphinella strobiligena]|nr:P-loop containing nucleoside triphosphate hydrolase protein [Delphinella strobiligena]